MRQKKANAPVILQVMEANLIGGVQILVRELCSHLQLPNGRYYIFLINRTDINHKTSAQFKGKGFNCVEVNLISIQKLLSYRLIKFFEVILITCFLLPTVFLTKTDIVHIHISQLFYLLPILKTLSFLNIPFIWTLHGDLNYQHFSITKLIARLKKLQNKGLPFKITQVSPDINHNLWGEFSKLGILKVIIPNGIDLDKFISSGLYRNSLRNQLNIPSSTVLLGSVGRLAEEKGYDLLINTFSQLKNIENFQLMIIGDGPLKITLNNLIQSHQLTGKIHLLGSRENIPEFLSILDIYLQPSRVESFGLAILEAMASGLPIIASRIGGIPNLLNNGGAGILVTQGSESELKNAIQLLARNPDIRNEYSIRACLRSKDFPINTMIDSYRIIYNSLS